MKESVKTEGEDEGKVFFEYLKMLREAEITDVETKRTRDMLVSSLDGLKKSIGLLWARVSKNRVMVENELDDDSYNDLPWSNPTEDYILAMEDYVRLSRAEISYLVTAILALIDKNNEMTIQIDRINELSDFDEKINKELDKAEMDGYDEEALRILKEEQTKYAGDDAEKIRLLRNLWRDYSARRKISE